MKTLLIVAVSLIVCSCYRSSEGGDYSSPIDEEESSLLDCERTCDVEVLCGNYVDPEDTYAECLDTCDYINTESDKYGELEDTECVDTCYTAVDSENLTCDDLWKCVMVGCEPWWAQG
jgi:hypothetical protein